MTGPATAIGRPRADLLRQRSVRQAWFLVAAGLLIPFFALGGARTGYRLRSREGAGHELLIAAGVTVFVVRAVLWVTTGVV